ncbi:MAG: MarR family winged helix-turn-helix transcriptional regulator [Desulfurococcales archaeon]|nr:MarR family winged helix-turn-helix transcriptional regulator [Desulfurococcales archaeon]
MEEEMKRLLVYLYKRRYISPNLIARESGVKQSRVYVLLARLEAEGYIKRMTFEQGKSCDSCPLKGICGGSCPSGTGRITIYTITDKGRRLVKEDE